ncbi:MAG: hypothetical protein UV05_C0002G0008 [candidate division CPR1 bacterium GW2011_GWA2_42_17]|uniref:NHL repeat containing protein n=1 Tax=candidate division CPR1 bacterium GW2011_GWA2_42_17 TaxID=1618341 RepID=A0A0G1BE89_9BACT|nr:MAG: hypothetical protein UV05_C0002G0008 [candidate division CPR1 bacterium GW2011_GWA2_42_17]
MLKLKVVSVAIVLVLLIGLTSQSNAAVQDLLVANEAGNSVLRYDGITGAALGAFVAAGSGGLTSPEDIKFGSDGNLYVACYSGTIKKYNGTTGAYIGNFVTAGSGGLANIIGMAFGPDNNLYVADFIGSSVKKYNGSTGAYMGDFVATGSGGLTNPRDIKFGPDGNLYIASMSTYSVKRYNGIKRYGFDGTYIDTFTLPGSYAGAGTYDLGNGPDGLLYAVEAAARVTRSAGTSPFLSLSFVPSAIVWTPFVPQTCEDIWLLNMGMATDLNEDCVVDFLDFAVMAQNWLVSN